MEEVKKMNLTEYRKLEAVNARKQMKASGIFNLLEYRILNCHTCKFAQNINHETLQCDCTNKTHAEYLFAITESMADSLPGYKDKLRNYQETGIVNLYISNNDCKHWETDNDYPAEI